VGHRSGAPALGALLRLLQFMVPEQLRSTIVQQHVQGHVVRGSPPPRDRALLAPQFGYHERIPHPHPPADSRIFGPQCFSLLLARHPWSQREQGSEPSLPSSNAIANMRGYIYVMLQFLAKNTTGYGYSLRFGVRRAAWEREAEGRADPRPRGRSPRCQDHSQLQCISCRCGSRSSAP
jgi:hypothetical protein